MWRRGNFDLERIIEKYKFIIIDTIINSPIDIVSRTYFNSSLRMRYEFEGWLISQSFSSSTACEYAGVIPNRKAMKCAIGDFTQGRTTNFYELSIADLNLLEEIIGGYIRGNAPKRIIKLYRQFLQHNIILKLLMP